MKELKFRAYDHRYVSYIYSDTVGLSSFFAYTKRGEWSIQQFTGLKDITGKMIYEDDIIHYDFDGDSYPEEAFDKNLICKYETNNGWYAFVEKDVIEDDGWCWLEVRNHCTVIGNIFENPELLN